MTIRRTEMSQYLNDDALAQRGAQREARDCTVVAAHIAYNVPYADAHAAFAANGRRNGVGTYRHQQRAVADHFNATWEPVSVQGILDDQRARYGKARKNLTTKMLECRPDLLEAGATYIMWTAGHTFCFKNGEVQDWTRGRRHQITNIVKVTV